MFRSRYGITNDITAHSNQGGGELNRSTRCPFNVGSFVVTSKRIENFFVFLIDTPFRGSFSKTFLQKSVINNIRRCSGNINRSSIAKETSGISKSAFVSRVTTSDIQLRSRSQADFRSGGDVYNAPSCRELSNIPLNDICEACGITKWCSNPISSSISSSAAQIHGEGFAAQSQTSLERRVCQFRSAKLDILYELVYRNKDIRCA